MLKTQRFSQPACSSLRLVFSLTLICSNYTLKVWVGARLPGIQHTRLPGRRSARWTADAEGDIHTSSMRLKLSGIWSILTSRNNCCVEHLQHEEAQTCLDRNHAVQGMGLQPLPLERSNSQSCSSEEEALIRSPQCLSAPQMCSGRKLVFAPIFGYPHAV